MLRVRTVDTSQHNCWLNEDVPANIPNMLVTDEVFQLDICWLNLDALVNIPLMLVTDEVFQLDISWLNLNAL